MCYQVVSKEPFKLKHCHNKHKTPEICDKAVDSYQLALKFVPDWFVESKIIEKRDSAVFSNGDIFFGNNIGLSSIILDNINLDNDNFDDCDPEGINHVRLMGWYNRFK